MLSKKTRDKTTVIKRRKIERIILNNNKRKTHNKKKAKDNIKPGSIAVSFAANELITKFLSGILFDVLYVLSIFGVFFYNALYALVHKDYFFLQLNAKLFLGAGLAQVNKRADVGRGGAACVDDNVSVEGRDLGAPAPLSL